MSEQSNNLKLHDECSGGAVFSGGGGQIRSGEFNPAMLTTAREARHFTQADVAGAMGVSQPLINQWEAITIPGLPSKRPSEEQIVKLAELLDFHPSLFYVSRPTRITNPSEFLHRALKRAKPRDLKAAHARCSIIDLQVDRLLALCPPPEDRIPDIDADNHAGDVEKIAAMTRARMGVPPGPVENLVDTIEACGGIVIDRDLEIDDVDALCRWVPGLPKLFFLNGNRPGDRMRLTLAHELGHTVMHFNRDVEQSLAETQAQRFAAAFLLPANEIRADLGMKVDIPKLMALKRKWRVSMQAIAYRAHQIGSITDTRYRSLFQQMSREGWRKNEPPSVAVRPESPRTFKRLLSAHIAEGYTHAQLAEMLFVTHEQLRQILLDMASPDWQDSGVRMRIAR